MSFFRMAEEDPNPIIRESPQYNIERLDICLQYIKNIMDLPIAVTPYGIIIFKHNFFGIKHYFIFFFFFFKKKKKK